MVFKGSTTLTTPEQYFLLALDPSKLCLSVKAEPKFGLRESPVWTPEAAVDKLLITNVLDDPIR
ncbi:hypothetical protein PISMIDRAFT_677171 [Pisolithus microcarpus 441]|uniref:Uncharacterized protein n=1 Tax=Pisolithus microcarpus 441 TaxID=765257 RepID=A0A0C9ZHT3_9AGAM|nr:hypothetical protein PISMIDRAFT_677171 [Pisolithus microcarpus 441]